MSVISDALKAAQRERARRESQGGQPPFVPVLVHLRSKAPTRGDSRRPILLAGVVAVVLGGAAFVAWKLQSRPALPTVPPLTSTILAEALAADTALGKAAAGKPVLDSTARTTRTASAPASSGRVPAPAQASVAAANAPDTVAVPQGQPATTPAPDSGTRSSGRLRVAVERSGPPSVGGLFAEAVAAHRAGDVVTARKLYDSVLVLSPSDADALNNLGVLLSSAHEFGRALEVLRRASTLAPRKADIWNNLGTVYREQGKNTDAIAAYRHALTLDTEHAGAKVGLAQQYVAIRSWPQAKVLLEEVAARHPQLSEAHYTLGQVLEQLQDRPGAIAAYEAFIRSAPERLAPYVELVKRRVEALSR